MTDEEMDARRTHNLDAVLSSSARKKVIVAGPGTGKTYTFSKVLERVDGEALVLSFLGNLVADLNKDLGDRATVRTFHGYCRGLLHGMDVPGVTRDVDYFPAFGMILDIDTRMMRDGVPEGAIERALMYLDDSEGVISAAIRIGVTTTTPSVTQTPSTGFMKRLPQNPAWFLPTDKSLVDEYQDFSRLESSLIERLAAVSPTLVAGDDDQALYGFKHATAYYLRELVASGEYERFELPFCTRCTEVLVDATHRVVERAQAAGLLTNRIEKEYTCFLPDKRTASEAFPKILHARCTVERNSAPYMCRYIAQAIGQIGDEDIALSWEKGHPTALVMGPPQFARRVFQYLQDLGVPNLEFRTSSPLEIDVLDGYRRLQHNNRSRLGWRLVLHATQPQGWEDYVLRAHLDGAELADLLPTAFRDHHLSIVDLLNRLVEADDLIDEEVTQLEIATGVPLQALRKRLGLDPDEAVDEGDHSAPRVVITSLLGAKGLQSEHSFVVGLNDEHFPQDNSAPTDDEVCQLLVALTRARQSCTLVSCGRFGNAQISRSVFLTWLGDLVETLTVNAAYWQSS